MLKRRKSSPLGYGRKFSSHGLFAEILKKKFPRLEDPTHPDHAEADRWRTIAFLYWRKPGLPAKQIAAAVGLSLANVEQRLHRMRRWAYSYGPLGRGSKKTPRRVNPKP